MKNLFFYIGLPHLRLKPLRSLLTLLGVAFGIALYVAISIINHSTKNSLRENIDAIAGKAKLTVTGGTVGFDDRVLSIIKKHPGVKSAIPMIEERAYIAGKKEKSGSLYVLGVDLLQEQSIRSYKTTDQKVINDPLVFLNQADSIIITKQFAHEHQLALDSKLKLATANGSRSFTVRGLLEPEGPARAYGGSIAIMDIDGAKLSFGKGEKVDRIDIITEAGYPITEVQMELERSLGKAYQIETPETQSKKLDSLLESFQLILTFFSSIALFAGLFLIINSISIAVAERRTEIGTLRALGATRTSMIILFVGEVIGMGILGSILGCLIGRILAEFLSAQVVTSVAQQFQTHISPEKLSFTTREFVITVLLGTLATILSAIWPSLKAAQIHPLESMKGYTEHQVSDGARLAKKLANGGLIILFLVTCSAVFEWERYSTLISASTKAGYVIATALFGPFVVILFLKGLERIPRGTFSAVFHFSHENLLRNPKRTINNVMALLVGLFLVMLISTIRSSFHDTLMGWLDQTFISDILVTSTGRIATTEVQALNENIQRRILKIPGVRAIGTGRGAGSRVIRVPYLDGKITIKAMDRFADFYSGRYISAVHAEPLELIQRLYGPFQPSVLASQDFLMKHHKKEGDTILLNTPRGTVQFRIVGAIYDYAPGGVLYIDRKIYKKFWNDSLVSAFAFNIQPGHDLEQVRNDIERTLGKQLNLFVISNHEFKVQTQEAIEQSFAYTRAIELIALIVGMLGLLNTLLISVIERTREIGMLRAVGSTQGQISQMIFWESILQGFLGACVAVVFGIYIGWLFVRYSLVGSIGWIIDFHVAIPAILSTITVGILVSIIAGYYPSKKASKLLITEALDYE